MAESRYSLPKVPQRSALIAEALNRQLQAVEADIQAGRLTEAASSLNDLVAAHPGDGRVYIAGWLLASKAGNTEAAYQSAARAVALAPKAANAHYSLSKAEQERGNIDAARRSIDAALALAPNHLQFLELAVNLANAHSDHVSRERYLRAAFAHDEKIPGIRSMIGNALRFQNKFDESEAWFVDAVAADPNDADGHAGLAHIAFQRDDQHKALAHITEALRTRPADEAFLYLKTIFSGETPLQQPEGMTRGLFDRYANRFDSHLVGTLKYRVPQLIAEKVLSLYPDRKLNILDLGCGTGLLGAALGPIDGYFVGVDLSRPMLEVAHKHAVYSRLHNVNLLDALDATDANEYEVIVAGDVFIYVGALEAAIANSFKVLRSGGWLFFSCETAPADGEYLVLHKTMRYAHTIAYVKRLLADAGFAPPSIDEIDLRLEKTDPIPGFLVAVQKPL
jgi:predicted TPR repeat methyltransferase